MPRAVSRCVFLLFLTVVLIFSFSSCGREKIEPADEGEAIEAAKRLVNEAEIWVRLFFTKGGMPFLEGGRTKGVYREVDGAEMAKLGFFRLSDLKNYERRIFSPSMCAIFDASLFSGREGGWNAALIEDTELDYSKGIAESVFVCFLADPGELPMIAGDEAVYDFSRATVTSNLGDRVSVSVPVSGVGVSEGKTAVKTLDLCRQDGEWLLDNYPHVRFPVDGD